VNVFDVIDAMPGATWAALLIAAYTLLALWSSR
jgi:hypothetical protein